MNTHQNRLYLHSALHSHFIQIAVLNEEKLKTVCRSDLQQNIKAVFGKPFGQSQNAKFSQ